MKGAGRARSLGCCANCSKKKGCKVTHTREPGGTKISEAVRRILLDPKNNITPIAELFLYETARTQHIADVIKPALEAGHIVVCDRFTDATIAYQGYGRGLDIAVIKKLNFIAACGIRPDMTVYLDISAEAGLRKARSIKKDFKKACDRLEGEDISFHERVRKGYLALAKQEPERIKVIATQSTIAGTQKKVSKAVLDCLKTSYKL